MRCQLIDFTLQVFATDDAVDFHSAVIGGATIYILFSLRELLAQDLKNVMLTTQQHVYIVAYVNQLTKRIVSISIYCNLSRWRDTSSYLASSTMQCLAHQL